MKKLEATTKYKVLIVEDDPIIAEDIFAYMEEFGYESVGPASNADEALKLFKKYNPDLCMLDVHLDNEIDGIQLASLIRKIKNVPVVFLTAFNDRDTIERIKLTGASAFLVKPVEENTLQTSVELALFNFYSDQSNHNEKENETLKDNCIFIKQKDSLEKIELENILFFEAYDNYSFLYINDKKHILSSSLRNIEDKLSNSTFLRVHRSYIINLHKIQKIETNYILLKSHRIPIGRTFRETLMKRVATL